MWYLLCLLTVRRTNNENSIGRSASVGSRLNKPNLQINGELLDEEDLESEDDDNIDGGREEMQLAVSPRFNWKDVEGVAKAGDTIR